MNSHIVGQTIIELKSVGSTNNYASGQLRENEVEEGTVFLAVNQISGRGQQQNKWESEGEKNLTFSIVLFPDFLEVHDQFLLSKVVCLGLAAFLDQYLDEVSIKWPNDIYVGERKICGILIENAIMGSRISSSVIGVGLNVNQEAFHSDAPNPVSMVQLAGRTFDLNQVLESLLEKIDWFYCRLIDGDHGLINELFVQNLFRKDSWHLYRDDSSTYEGRILGVNEIGQLRIEERDGRINEYHFKEVSYLLDWEK